MTVAHLPRWLSDYGTFHFGCQKSFSTSQYIHTTANLHLNKSVIQSYSKSLFCSTKKKLSVKWDCQVVFNTNFGVAGSHWEAYVVAFSEQRSCPRYSSVPARMFQLRITKICPLVSLVCWTIYSSIDFHGLSHKSPFAGIKGWLQSDNVPAWRKWVLASVVYHRGRQLLYWCL